MLAALATLVFGVTLWLVVFLAVKIYGESREKIISAIRPMARWESGVA